MLTLRCGRAALAQTRQTDPCRKLSKTERLSQRLMAGRARMEGNQFVQDGNHVLPLQAGLHIRIKRHVKPWRLSGKERFIFASGRCPDANKQCHVKGFIRQNSITEVSTLIFTMSWRCVIDADGWPCSTRVRPQGKAHGPAQKHRQWQV